jgi:RND family efflux transporter MFP subunit
MNESKRVTKRDYLRLGKALVAAAICAASFPGQSAEVAGLDCVLEPYEVVEVGSPVNGVIQTIYVERNSLVKKGQILADLESDVEKATVELAGARAELTAEIQLRRAAVEFNQRNQARIDELHEKKAVPFHVKDESDTDLSKSRWQFLKAKDAQRLAALELAKARAILRLRTILSPIDGVVVARHKAVGEFVEDQPILRLAQIDPLRVDVIAPVELFGSIREGMQAEVALEHQGNTTYTATVTMVDRVIDAASGTFDVRLELPNPDYRIPSGLKCDLRFVEDADPPLAEAADRSMDEMLQEAVTDAAPEALASSQGSEEAPASQPSVAQSFPDNEIVPESVAEPAAELPASLQASKETPAPQPSVAQSFPDNEIAPEAVTEPAADSLASLEVSKETPPPPSIAKSSLEATGFQPAVSSCRALGPIASSEQADRLAAALADQAARITRQQQTESVIDSYMVMTPFPATPGETGSLKARLRAKGIGHFYVLPRGENKGRISLGVYNKKSWAERRKAQLAEVGIETQVGVRTKTRPQYWLNVEMTADDANELQLLRTVERMAPEQNFTLGPCPDDSRLAEIGETGKLM